MWCKSKNSSSVGFMFILVFSSLKSVTGEGLTTSLNNYLMLCHLCAVDIFGEPVSGLGWTTPGDPLLYFLISPLHVSRPAPSRLSTSVPYDALRPRWCRTGTRRSSWGNMTWSAPTRLRHRRSPGRPWARTEPTTITTTTAAIDGGTRTRSRSPWMELHQCSRPTLLVRKRRGFTWPLTCWTKK